MENNNEIKDAVVEVIEEDMAFVPVVDNCKGFKIAAGVGLLGLGGVIAYKKVIKPMIAKIKAKKDQQLDTNTNEQDCQDDY